jgi:hypothetical protein
VIAASENPFRSEKLLRIRYHLSEEDWESALQRLERMQFKGGILGPPGTGKTTLLEELERRLNEAGRAVVFVRLGHGGTWREAVEAGKHAIVLCDGLEGSSNPLRLWWRVQQSRRFKGFVASFHYISPLPVWIRCRTSPRLLAEIGAELLGCTAAEVEPRAEVLYKKHQGNIREALREWYDSV